MIFLIYQVEIYQKYDRLLLNFMIIFLVIQGKYVLKTRHRLFERTITFKIISDSTIGLMQKYPPIFKKMFLNDVALLWMRGFHAYDTASVS